MSTDQPSQPQRACGLCDFDVCTTSQICVTLLSVDLFENITNL